MSFEDRLQKAVQRGTARREEKQQQAREKALSKEDLKRLHSKHSLQLSEHIEACLGKIPNLFPGFKFETIFGDRGWGAACSRDDLSLKAGRRENNYSRIEMTIRPFGDHHVIDLAAKGTIKNKEVFNRNHFERIHDVDPATFVEFIDLWVIEYAELFAASK